MPDAVLDLFKQQFIEANGNSRLILSTFITWYTFFWTLNNVALGFLYAPRPAGEPRLSRDNHAALVRTLSILFTVLNLLGVGACVFCWVSMSQLRSDAIAAATAWHEFAKSHALTSSTGLISASFIKYVFSAASLSLLINIGAWIYLPRKTALK